MISNDISKAVQLLNEEEVIGFPTETVYGLAGNAFNENAIAKIFKIKERPSFNPLIVHVKDPAQIHEIACNIPSLAYELIHQFWPGPLTVILKKQPHISNLITANRDTVAVRMPQHPVALELLNQLSFPLVAPSANPYTAISPTQAIHVQNYFQDKIPLILDGGPCTAGIESTIIGFEGNRVILYRLGSIPLEAIEALTGKIEIKNHNEKSPVAPGMTLKHYAPKTKVVLMHWTDEELKNQESKNIGLLRFSTFHAQIQPLQQRVLSPKQDLKEAAANLYQALHELDQLNLDGIIAERLPDYGLGRTINDRLERAAKNN